MTTATTTTAVGKEKICNAKNEYTYIPYCKHIAPYSLHFYKYIYNFELGVCEDTGNGRMDTKTYCDQVKERNYCSPTKRGNDCKKTCSEDFPELCAGKENVYMYPVYRSDNLNKSIPSVSNKHFSQKVREVRIFLLNG